MIVIKNLLFDFGGVFYEIDPEKSYIALKNLQIPVDEWLKKKNNVFHQLERGEISESDFLRLMQVSSPIYPDFEEIINAFNQTLIGCPLENVRMLARLSRHYNCILLSNTNCIHYQKFSEEILSSRLKSRFYSYFKKEYYSFQIGLRKPEPEIFSYVLKNSNLHPKETLFVDDDLQNILTAASIKINSFHFQQFEDWKKMIEKFNLLI